jgi:hypothetical protein
MVAEDKDIVAEAPDRAVKTNILFNVDFSIISAD